MPARQATASAPRPTTPTAASPLHARRAPSLAIASSLETPAALASTAEKSLTPTEPGHAGADWREHDLMIRRFQQADLTPAEIAVVLDSKGLRVKTWHVSETFVRSRLKALGFSPNPNRKWYAQAKNCYRQRLPAV